jgi:hypothetical protein
LEIGGHLAHFPVGVRAEVCPQSVAACTFGANFRLCKLKGTEDIGGGLGVGVDSGFVRFFERSLQIEDLSFVNVGIDLDLIVVLIVEIFDIFGCIGLLLFIS